MDGLLGNLFGYQEEDPLLALLPPEQRARLQQQARGQGMTNLGLALLQAGGPSRTPTGIGSRLGQAGIQAMQANQGVMDRGLERMLAARKLQQEESQRSLRQQAISALSPDEQIIAQLDPSALGEIYKTRLGIGGKGPDSISGKLNPSDFTPESLAQFKETGGDFRVLVSKQDKPPFKVGDIRDFVQGTERITQEYQADGTWKTISRGSAFAPPSQFNVNVGDRAFAGEAQKEQAKTLAGIQQSGLKAGQTIREVTKLGNLLDKIPTGSTARLQQIAGNFGIPTKGLDDIQAAQAIINRLVPQQRPPGSGTMSDADLALFRESLPRIINQPGGNKIIIDTLKSINDYLIEEGKIANEAINGRISPEEAFTRIQYLKNPLENIAAQPTTGGDLQTRAQEELRRRRGR